MKKLVLGILTVLVLISCSSDDDSSQSSSSDITIDGVSYDFSFGYAVDRAGFAQNESSFAFVLATDPFTLDEQGLPGVIALGNTDGVRGVLSFQLESLTTVFETGIYTLDFTTNSLEKSVIFCQIRLPGDDGQFNLFDNFVTGISGTINITGTPDNFTLEFDIQLDNGENLNFVYNEGTTYVDGTWD